MGVIIIGASVDIIGNKMTALLPDHGGQINKQKYTIKRLETDILIVGSSRASHHYVPDLLGQEINNYLGSDYSIYNAGMDGHFIDCSCLIIESVLSRYTPKIIILDVSDDEISNSELKNRLLSFTPYYKRNLIVKRYLDKLGLKEKIKLKSNLYRYNEKLIHIANGFISGKEKDIYNGYEPLFKVMTNATSTKKEPNEHEELQLKADEFSKDNFSNILRKCNEEDINLIVVTSPRYGSKKPNKIITSLCNEYKIPYVNMEKYEYFNNHPEFFQDIGHLNDSGAKEFTSMFFERLKQYLNS